MLPMVVPVSGLAMVTNMKAIWLFSLDIIFDKFIVIFNVDRIAILRVLRVLREQGSSGTNRWLVEARRWHGNNPLDGGFVASLLGVLLVQVHGVEPRLELLLGWHLRKLAGNFVDNRVPASEADFLD